LHTWIVQQRKQCSWWIDTLAVDASIRSAKLLRQALQQRQIGQPDQLYSRSTALHLARGSVLWEMSLKLERKMLIQAFFRWNHLSFTRFIALLSRELTGIKREVRFDWHTR
jgi:hypothetical protein